LSLKTRLLAGTHSEDFVILACVALTQYHSVTDRRTDAQAKTREALHALACNNNKIQKVT